MPRYIWKDGDFVSRETGEPMHVTHSGICMPFVISDVPEYVSPVTERRSRLARTAARK
jgi:hypothetical protein